MCKKINLTADARGFIVFHVHTFRLRTRWKVRNTSCHTSLPKFIRLPCLPLTPALTVPKGRDTTRQYEKVPTC